MDKTAQAKVDALINKLKGYKTFDLTAKEQELEAAREALNDARELVARLQGEITDYKVTIGEAVTEIPTETLEADKLTDKVKEIMPRFPGGASGKVIADAIGMYGVNGETISGLYWTENQSWLRKTGQGVNTKYFLATDTDLEAINEAKAKEKAERDAKAAEREARKAKAKPATV